jgi:hypothetical protein
MDPDLSGPVIDLPGLEPMLEQAAQEALRKRTAEAAAAVLTGLVGDEQLEQLARTAVERQLLDLAAPPAPYFPTLPEWIEEWLLPVYRRSDRGHEHLWCPEWWRHPEAVARLDALWRAWEHLRLDPATGMSVWFRDHADHHMTVLLSATGPFQGCDGQHSTRPLEPLTVTPTPEGMFQPEDELTTPSARSTAAESTATSTAARPALSPARSR